MWSGRIETPIGVLAIEVASVADATPVLVRLERERNPEAAPDLDLAPPVDAVRRQLAEYFAGRRRTFDVQLARRGTDFQRQVWEALRRIPYGETWSYGRLAREVGRPGGSQAVGQANHRNPFLIVVPCHRVIDADGGLGGFGAGPEAKRHLLELEGVLPRRLF